MSRRAYRRAAPEHGTEHHEAVLELLSDASSAITPMYSRCCLRVVGTPNDGWPPVIDVIGCDEHLIPSPSGRGGKLDSSPLVGRRVVCLSNRLPRNARGLWTWAKMWNGWAVALGLMAR